MAVPSSQVKEKYVYEGIRQIGLEACGADPVGWKGWKGGGGALESLLGPSTFYNMHNPHLQPISDLGDANCDHPLGVPQQEVATRSQAMSLFGSTDKWETARVLDSCSCPV